MDDRGKPEFISSKQVVHPHPQKAVNPKSR